MSRKSGKSFEGLTKQVFEILSSNEKYTSVEEDVMLDSPDGPRQFDVVIRSTAASIDLLTVVECRDYPNKNLDVTHVDGLHSKQLDVNASKAVLVARKGFSKGAMRKANRLGITLCTAHDTSNLKDIGFQMPVIVTEIYAFSLRPKGTFQLLKGTQIDKVTLARINDRNVADIFTEAALGGEISPNETNGFVQWVPATLGDTIFTRSVDGDKIEFDEFSMQYKIKNNFYFGYVLDLPNTIGLKNLSDGETNVLVRAKDVFDYKQTFLKYSKREDIPSFAGISLDVLTVPKVEATVTNIEVTKLEAGKVRKT